MELLAGGSDRGRSLRYAALGAWCERCARELKRVGVTIQQLGEEYRQEQPDGYSYSQFCYHFQVWRDGDEVTMHIEHKVGDKPFVDFAGKKLTVSERHSGGRRDVESFVAVLGASQLCYLQVVETQRKADLIAASTGSLEYIGGVPAAIVPDCLKSAVTKADPYEPDLNSAYAAFARHAWSLRPGGGPPVDEGGPSAYGVRVEFEWDKAKNDACFERRGFDFAYAVRAFLDPFRIVMQDRRRDYGEDRYRLLGTIDGRTYVVVYTTRGPAIRIISARKANPKEVADYEHNSRQD